MLAFQLFKHNRSSLKSQGEELHFSRYFKEILTFARNEMRMKMVYCGPPENARAGRMARLSTALLVLIRQVIV
jgi:hypothetical protein